MYADQAGFPMVFMGEMQCRTNHGSQALGDLKRGLRLQRSRVSAGGWVTFALMLLLCFPLFWIGLLMTENDHQCASCGIKIGQIVLDRGANIHALNDFGENALSCAARTGQLRFVELLIAHGADSAVRPHGNPLGKWVSHYSGLADAKIKAILDAIPPPPPQER